MSQFHVCSHTSTDADDTFVFRACKGCDSALFVQTISKIVGASVEESASAAWDLVKPRATEWNNLESAAMTGSIPTDFLRCRAHGDVSGGRTSYQMGHGRGVDTRPNTKTEICRVHFADRGGRRHIVRTSGHRFCRVVSLC